VSGGVGFSTKRRGVVVMRVGGWEGGGVDGGGVDGGGGMSWQSQHVTSGGTAMLSMIIEYWNLPVMIACKA
jgi:hypothetical protein